MNYESVLGSLVRVLESVRILYFCTKLATSPFLILISSFLFLNLLEVGDEAEVLVSVIEVLTAHAPYEGVVMGGSGGVDGPFG